MPNLPRLSQAPFISPTNNMLLIPCFMDEVHAVSYLVLSITSNCLQLPASVFKVISLQPPRLGEKGMRSQRRASSSSLSNCRAEGAENERAEAEAHLQLIFPNFSLLGAHVFCSQESTLLGVCLTSSGNPPGEAGRLLDWTLGVSPGTFWTELGHLHPRSPHAPACSLGITPGLLGPYRGCTDMRDVAGPGSAGGHRGSQTYFQYLLSLLGGIVLPPTNHI